jgi:hypothetical protein
MTFGRLAILSPHFRGDLIGVGSQGEGGDFECLVAKAGSKAKSFLAR